MKKGLYCLLALLTVLVAAGCSVNQDNTDNTTTENASESLSRYDEILREAEDSADGWNSYELAAVPDIRNYPTDMAFSDESTGIITTDYHGYDQYAYQTVDGGNSWNGLTMDDFSEEVISYIEGDRIEWENGQWALTISKVPLDGRETSVCRSENGMDWSLDTTNK